jgi:hypothetical protein
LYSRVENFPAVHHFCRHFTAYKSTHIIEFFRPRNVTKTRSLLITRFNNRNVNQCWILYAQSGYGTNLYSAPRKLIISLSLVVSPTLFFSHSSDTHDSVLVSIYIYIYLYIYIWGNIKILYSISNINSRGQSPRIQPHTVLDFRIKCQRKQSFIATWGKLNSYIIWEQR